MSVSGWPICRFSGTLFPWRLTPSGELAPVPVPPADVCHLCLPVCDCPQFPCGHPRAPHPQLAFISRLGSCPPPRPTPWASALQRCRALGGCLGELIFPRQRHPCHLTSTVGPELMQPDWKLPHKVQPLAAPCPPLPAPAPAVPSPGSGEGWGTGGGSVLVWLHFSQRLHFLPTGQLHPGPQPHPTLSTAEDAPGLGEGQPEPRDRTL